MWLLKHSQVETSIKLWIFDWYPWEHLKALRNWMWKFTVTSKNVPTWKITFLLDCKEIDLVKINRLTVSLRIPPSFSNSSLRDRHNSISCNIVNNVSQNPDPFKNLNILQKVGICCSTNNGKRQHREVFS